MYHMRSNRHPYWHLFSNSTTMGAGASLCDGSYAFVGDVTAFESTVELSSVVEASSGVVVIDTRTKPTSTSDFPFELVLDVMDVVLGREPLGSPLASGLSFVDFL